MSLLTRQNRLGGLSHSSRRKEFPPGMRDATLHYSANQISSSGARITFSRSLLLRMQVHSGEVDNIENAVDQIVN